jgi:DNA-binding NtrC family response regulator
VLLAEDDADLRELLASVLRRDGYVVREAGDGIELLRLMTRSVADEEGFDLIISDVRMPGCTGLQVLSLLRRVESSTCVVLITAFGDIAVHAEAARLGAAAVFDKPFDVDDLRTAVINLTRSGRATT